MWTARSITRDPLLQARPLRLRQRARAEAREACRETGRLLLTAVRADLEEHLRTENLLQNLNRYCKKGTGPDCMSSPVLFFI